MSSFNTYSLEGKPFELGKQDCYELVRGFYRLNFSIDLPKYARPNDWNPEKDNMIENLHAHAGFTKLDVDENWPPHPADLLACTVGGSVPNHLVVFMGKNEILHHKAGQFSSKELMRPAWRRYCSYILRHPEVPDLSPQKETMDLMEAYREGLV